MSLKLEYFSITGKISSEKSKGKSEKIKSNIGKDLFTPDKYWQINNYLCDKEQIEKECNLDIDEIKKNIKLNYNDKKMRKENKGNKKEDKKEKKKKKEKEKEKGKEDIIFKKVFQGFKYKYHNIHYSKMEKFKKEGLLTKFNAQQQHSSYHPKYEYLYQRIITGPKWSKLSYRKKNLFEEQNYISNLSYNVPDFYKNNIKGFVDMSKQAKRKGMLDDILKQEKLKFNFKTALDNNRNNTPFLLLISKDNEEGIILNNENNYIINKHKNNNKYKLAPDFNRYLSREHLNNLSKRKGRIINGDLSPNYNSIETSTKMMVFYKKSRNHRLKDNRNLNSFSPNNFYDASKTFEKIYGNKYKVVPNFEKMTPRKYDVLPFFLNGLTNRNIYTMRTDKSLKMNNYSGSKIYNLCGDMKEDLNKYKNSKISSLRRYYSFENIKECNKKKVLIDLRNKIKKFNRLVLSENKHNDY